MPNPLPKASRRPAFWRRRVWEPIRGQLTQGVSPKKIALTLGISSALAFFPILGTTTLLCFLAGLLLRLNQSIVQGVNLLCAVAYLPMVLIFVRAGDRLVGAKESSFELSAMAALFRRDPGEFFARFGASALHGILAWSPAAPLWIALIYFATLSPLRASARRARRPSA